MTAAFAIPIPTGLDAIQAQFGAIEWVDVLAPRGFVQVTNGWDRANIITVALPLVGKQQVNRALADVFKATFAEVVASGLGPTVKTCGGVYCARHKMGSPKRPLSVHSWGIAIDLNPATNPPGPIGDMDPRLVDLLEHLGWEWGGRWKTRDDQHFQWCHGY